MNKLHKPQIEVFVSLAVIIIGALVLLAWANNYTALLSIIPNAPTIKFNTALLFILISFTIVFFGKKPPLLHWLAMGISAFILVISSLTLSQYIFNVSIGIDNIFFVDNLTVRYPGRMSSATAFCFMLISLTKLIRGAFKNDSNLKIVDYMVTLVAIISLLAISTYVLRAITNDNVLVFDTMAIHTAILFFLISFTISLKHPNHSFIGFLTGKYIGSKQARALLPFVVGLPILLSGALLYFIKSGLLDTSYGVSLYTISYAVISIVYFSIIFTKLNKSDQARVELEENLRASNQELQQYKLALDQSSIVSVTDLDGTITYVNDKFTEVSGFSREEAIGQTHRIVESGHHPSSFFKDLWDTINSGSVWVGGIKNKTKDARYYWVHTVIVPLRNQNGDINQFLTIKQDITEQYILSQQYENLKLKNKELEQFTYLASHDLQEPLRTLDNMTTLLQKTFPNQLGDKGEKIITFISQASNRMSALVKALLDYSIIGINKELKWVNTTAIIDDIKTDLSDLIKSENAQISYSKLHELYAYPVELRLLFQNLIQNAIKFRSAERDPEVYISSTKEQHSYTFSVRDNGIGMSNDQLVNIFGLFKRLHNKREYEGTGIGLAHCEKIVHIHGGSIWAKSEIGKGSEFIFTIPILKLN